MTDTVIRFKIDRDKNNMTWEDYETIELAQEGEVKLRLLRPLVARFMVDENGNPIPHKDAMKTLASLPLVEVRDVFTQFANAFRETAVPNPSGGSSKPPSEVVPPSESPDG